jgi:hypothetical protein
MVLQVYEVFYLRRLQVDIVWAKTPLAEFLNAFSGGFFIYEMFGLCAVYVPAASPSRFAFLPADPSRMSCS